MDSGASNLPFSFSFSAKFWSRDANQLTVMCSSAKERTSCFFQPSYPAHSCLSPPRQAAAVAALLWSHQKRNNCFIPPSLDAAIISCSDLPVRAAATMLMLVGLYFSLVLSAMTGVITINCSGCHNTDCAINKHVTCIKLNAELCPRTTSNVTLATVHGADTRLHLGISRLLPS